MAGRQRQFAGVRVRTVIVQHAHVGRSSDPTFGHLVHVPVFGSLDDDGVTRLQTVDVTQVATGAMTGIGAVAYGSGHDGLLVVSDALIVQHDLVGALLDCTLPTGFDFRNVHPSDYLRVSRGAIHRHFARLWFGYAGRIQVDVLVQADPFRVCDLSVDGVQVVSEEHPADLGDEDDDDGEYDSDGALEDMFTGGNRVGWSASVSGVASFAVSAYMVGTIVGFWGFPVDDFSPVGQPVRGAVFHAFVPLTVLVRCGHIQFSWFFWVRTLSETVFYGLAKSSFSCVNYSTIAYEVSGFESIETRRRKIVKNHFMFFESNDFSFF